MKRYHLEYDIDVPYLDVPDVNVPGQIDSMKKYMQPYMDKLKEKKDQNIDKMNENMEKLKDQGKRFAAKT